MWAEGDEVDVFDPDMQQWLPGLVQSVGPMRHPSGAVWDTVSVRTMSMWKKLPLVIVLAVEDPRIRLAAGTTPAAPPPSSSADGQPLRPE